MTDYDPYDVFLLFRGLSTWLALILAGFILLGVFRQSGRLIRWLRVPRIRMGGLSWSREDFTAGWLITGGTGTGKTLSGFTRLLYETFRCEKDWGGIVIDDKGHFHQTVLAMARHFGREQDVILLRPGESPEVKPAHRFNLTGNRDIPYLTYARMVVDTAVAMGQRNEQAFFRTQVRDHLTAALETLHLLRCEVTLENAYHLLLNNGEVTRVVDQLKRLSDPAGHRLAVHFEEQYLKQPEEQLGGVKGSISNYLSGFMAPELNEVFFRDSTFTFDDLDRGKIICVALPQKFAVQRRYLSTFLKQLFYFHALSRYDHPVNERTGHNLLVLWADEAQHFVTDSEDGLSDYNAIDRIREARATVVMSTQSLSSFLPPLKREKAEVLWLNLRIQYLRAAQAGELRREEVTVWLGQDIPNLKPDCEERKDPDLFYSSILADAAAATDKLADPMRAVLGSVGISLEPLDSQAVIDAWQRTLNPSAASRRRKITAPAGAFSLTDMCWTSELRGLGDRGFIMDDEHYKAFSLQRLFAVGHPGILDHLTTLPIPDFSVTVFLHRLPKAELMSRLQARLQRVQRQLQRRRDPQLEVTQAQLEEKIAQLARGLIVPLEMKFIIVLHAPTQEELRRQEDLVKGAAARINLQLFEATLAATNHDLFLMTLPGRLHSDDPCFVVYGESDYLATVLPVPNTFEAHLDGAWALFEGPYGNPIGARCFVGEGEASTPQHCLVSGTTGSGKSFFLDKLELETHHYFDSSFILDFGGSHNPYVDAVGGTRLIITPDCPWTFNPFDTEGLPLSSTQRALITALVALITGVAGDDNESQDKHALLARHVAGVCEVFADAWLRRQSEAERLRIARLALVLHQLAGERMCEPIEAFIAFRDELKAGEANAIQRLAAPTEAEVRTFLTKHRDALRDLAFAYMPEHPTLIALREHLELEGRQDEKCQRVADRLRPWCRGGSYGKLFDGQSNASLTGKVTQLEMGRLDKTAERFQTALWFLLLIVLRQHCLSRPRHELKRIVLEEISRVLEVPGNESIIKEMFSTFRKFRIQCTLVCQQLAQLENFALRSIVLGNVRMGFFFNPGSAKDLDLISEHLPLSEAAKAMILKYVRPDQLRQKIYSECCYFHLTAGEPYVGTIRFVPPVESNEP